MPSAAVAAAVARKGARRVCIVLVLISAVTTMLFGEAALIERTEQRSDQRSECEGCGEDCDKCKFGSAISHWCGIRECLKGPGEMCGGVRHKYGVCGEGMYCRCHKCSGCSVETLECFDGYCPYEHYQQLLRHPDRLQNLQLE